MVILIIIIFGITLIVTLLKLILTAFIDVLRDSGNKSPPIEESNDTHEINRLERIENYDRQIDGYTQLIKMLDGASREESDPKKKAAILSKQLATLEKLNKTIEKREKLNDY